jgi:hypothetical protein
MTHASSPASPRPEPWWKFGFVWLVVGGPAVVVVASFVTLWLALRTPDPVVDENYYQKGIAINKALEEKGQNLAPAMRGRNHAATPAQDVPR